MKRRSAARNDAKKGMKSLSAARNDTKACHPEIVKCGWGERALLRDLLTRTARNLVCQKACHPEIVKCGWGERVFLRDLLIRTADL